ncbi:MAG: hypothetical protein M3Z46_03735 [Actinomycetota bacterium]|nr:hypothetical protein [Actinomycetota bacterium]
MNNSNDRKQLRLDCPALQDIAQRFSPVLRFHEQERFFPVLAESWLTHTTEAPWTSDAAHQMGDLAPDPFRRGMALWETSGRLRRLQVTAGQPVGGDRPLQLSVDPSDPYAIGTDRLKTVTNKAFLDLAGWMPDTDMSTGDIERLYALFSELAAAINQNIDWIPLAGAGDLPHAWIPQPVNPTTYCEARWAREFPQLNDAGGLKDFPQHDPTVNQYLALTYHYLFPAKELGIDGVGYHLEGQWEAATLFFRGEPDKEEGKEGGLIFTPPEVVVVSQGIDQAGDHHRTELDGWGDVERLGEHPILYVAKGTHRFYFHPVTGETTNPQDNPNPGGDPGAHDDDRDEGGITDLLILALILLALAALVLAIFGFAVLAIIAAIVLIALALWALFEWLASLFDSGDNDNSGDPVPGSQGNDEAGGDGTQTGSGDGPPAGSPPGDPGGGGGGGTFGLPNTGSPTGQATVSFDVRVVDRLFQHGEKPTGYPSATGCESPTWWDYSGGWGVKMINGFGSGWQNGTRRVDEHGRSWGYWTSLRLATVLNGGNPKG